MGAPDYYVIVSFFALIVLGLIALFSASYFTACQKFNDCYFYLKHQLFFGLLPGLVVFLFFYFFDYRRFRKISFVLFILTLFLLAAVLSPAVGLTKGDARRWIQVGNFVFQPSEIVKLSFLIYLTAWLAQNKNKIRSFKMIFIPFIIILGIVSLLIVLQPDIGTLSVIVAAALAVYFIAGAPWRYILFLVIGLVAVLVILVISAPYRLERIITFLKPEIDPGGIGYHINQAILAVGSGGIFGRGLGHSFQKIYYLPEVISDSIFAVMAEEFGFILISLVVFLYFYLAYRVFRLVKLCPDDFGQLLAAGIGFWFILQTIINMGAMLGLLPLTGIPLPFIGYGGSNMVIFFAAFGIIVNISRHAPENKKASETDS